jgi:hypothetical protein
MPNLPLTADGNKAALLAVDLFTGYIQICPIKDKKTKTLIEALEKTIFQPFGIPKLIRSDEETGFFRSEDFYKYLKPLGVKYLPTSVGAPWANSTAERSIRTIKEAARNFLLQEKVDDSWDKFAHFFTAAHNQSTSIYGFAPEELMFGYTKPNAHDLLQFWPGVKSHSEYVEKIFPLAESNRKLSRARSVKKSQENRSYKNAMRTVKQFRLGQVVAHRQLQYGTGTASKMQPQHTGPYVINAITPDGCSALIEHLYTGDVKKAHFTNMQILNFHPSAGNRVDQNFDDNLMEMLAGKQTLRSCTRRLLPNVGRNQESPPVHRHSVTSDEPHFPEDLMTVEIPDPVETQTQDFGTLRDEDSDIERHLRHSESSHSRRSSSSWDTDPSIFHRKRKNPWTDTEESDEEERHTDRRHSRHRRDDRDHRPRRSSHYHSADEDEEERHRSRRHRPHYESDAEEHRARRRSSHRSDSPASRHSDRHHSFHEEEGFFEHDASLEWDHEDPPQPQVDFEMNRSVWDDEDEPMELAEPAVEAREVEEDTQSVNDAEEVLESPSQSQTVDSDFDDMEEVPLTPPPVQIDDAESDNDVEEVQESQPSSNEETTVVSTEFWHDPDEEEETIVVPVVFETEEEDDSGILTMYMTEF